MTKQVLDLFTGTANPELADEVSKILGIKISKADVGYFSDGEIKVQIEDNVRGHDTFILQSTCAPSNKNLMELMFLADALKRSSASRITAIVPYYGYARQDRRVRSARVPISAKVVADMFYSVGIDRVLTVDLHSETIQGFFDMPADNVYATKLMVDDIKKNNPDNNIVVVSPDVGGVVRSRALAKQLNDLDLAAIISTDIATDGTLKGPNVQALREIAEISINPVIASGGIGSIADLISLADFADEGIEGIRLKNKPVFSVQYHPESNPGPQDSVYLFKEFIESMKKNAKKKRY